MTTKPMIRMLAAVIAFGSMAAPSGGKSAAAELNVLATTFPICQIVRNVTQGREGLKVDLMLPARTGCPHEYALTPRDMRKLAAADVLVTNGLGLDGFAGEPALKANPRIMIIDSAAGIREILHYADSHGHGSGHNHAHTDEEHRGAPNPHLFASPRMHARLAVNIAAGLSAADPDGAALYAGNARSYGATMTRLADEMSAMGRRLRNNRIVQPHGVFDYLARDMGLEIAAVMQQHEHGPSASDMLRLVGIIRKKRVGAVVTEPQYPEDLGLTLSQEAGVPVAMLDPGATGPVDAPLSWYETVMRRNMQTIAKTLGAAQP